MGAEYIDRRAPGIWILRKVLTRRTECPGHRRADRKIRRFQGLPGFVAGLLIALAGTSHADTAMVAVAANFSDAAEALRRNFEQDRPHRLTLVSGATGKLYAQIVHGAPFDILLAADDLHPGLLVQKGQAVAESLWIYARGRLCLWSPDPQRIATDPVATLRTASGKLAIANPELAPYGLAALATLESLDLADRYRGRLVMGENVAQAYAMVATGNAELGFVALSLIRAPGRTRQGNYWLVPADLHSPIQQQGVLLLRAKHNDAAVEFIEYLKSPAARTLMDRFGYDT